MASSEKRCLYEVLGLQRDCTPDEIRSAYRKLALQRHPDKLIKSGLSDSDATASFQELVNAYEVLSDTRERAWYDSHRSQILFSGPTSSSSSSSSVSVVVPDLFSYFSSSVYNGFGETGKGFYKVYGDVFERIYRNELNYVKRLGLVGVVVKEAPLMGGLGSGNEQVNAFYGYWLGFVTVMDFAWEDMYDAMAGVNRKSRRVMEEENKKVRKKARREYVETVRGLAEFVKKRDKRVIDMQVKRNEEMERRREEERVKKVELAREKAERARSYEEPEWAKVEEEDVVEEVEEEGGGRRNELYCVACGKKFKSDKQWKNHEQSRKHKDKVAELREAFGEEDEDEEEEDDEEDDYVDGFVSADEVEKIKEQFEGVEIEKEEKGDDQESQSEDEFVDVDNGGKGADDDEKDEEEDDDDEDSVLKAMLNSRKNLGNTRKQKKVYVEVEEEVDLMQYNNVKGRRNRRGRKETATKDEDKDEGSERIDKPEISKHAEVDEKVYDGLHAEEPPSAENENDGGGEENKPTEKIKVPKQAPKAKVASKKEASAKAKNGTRGKKLKATSRNSGNECDTCGVDFDSRTKLHKHLNDTGHASIKSR